MKSKIFFDFLTELKKKDNINNIIPNNIEKFDSELMEIAKIWAKKSYCKKRQVGAVISEMLPPNMGQIIAHGYNGTLPGVANICEETFFYCSNCNRKSKEEKEIFDGDICKYCNARVTKRKKMITNDFTYHAEQNAIAVAARRGVSLLSTQIHVTCSPCKECAKLIVNVGIKRVVYLEDYKDLDGINFLKTNGIQVIKYNP